ncbi:hypothetical protein B0H11DRAFT_2249457 [Mycena galericulata]|nr:hypothetical protein B0H11DRAFT_2249457 [Mycena galericulata]
MSALDIFLRDPPAFNYDVPAYPPGSPATALIPHEPRFPYTLAELSCPSPTTADSKSLFFFNTHSIHMLLCIARSDVRLSRTSVPYLVSLFETSQEAFDAISKTWDLIPHTPNQLAAASIISYAYNSLPPSLRKPEWLKGFPSPTAQPAQFPIFSLPSFPCFPSHCPPITQSDNEHDELFALDERPGMRELEKFAAAYAKATEPRPLSAELLASLRFAVESLEPSRRSQLPSFIDQLPPAGRSLDHNFFLPNLDSDADYETQSDWEKAHSDWSDPEPDLSSDSEPDIPLTVQHRSSPRAPKPPPAPPRLQLDPLQPPRMSTLPPPLPNSRPTIAYLLDPITRERVKSIPVTNGNIHSRKTRRTIAPPKSPPRTQELALPDPFPRLTSDCQRCIIERISPCRRLTGASSCQSCIAARNRCSLATDPLRRPYSAHISGDDTSRILRTQHEIIEAYGELEQAHRYGRSLERSARELFPPNRNPYAE